MAPSSTGRNKGATRTLVAAKELAVPKKKKRSRPLRPLPLKWEFAANIPTEDFLKTRRSAGSFDWSEGLASFLLFMENGKFLAWEAVIAEEQGLALTRQQETALKNLVGFGDVEEDDEHVFSINEIARPSKPWYEILNQIVSHLLIEPFRTFDIHFEYQCEGWGWLVACLEKHAAALSLPPGVTSPLEVVPAELRHRLWLQDCFDDLSGLGQEKELTLENEEQRRYRIEDFISSLRKHKDSVQYFDLTLDSLLTRVIVPEEDRPILIREMQERLGMKSTADRLADYL